ncbi:MULTISPECIES: dioxygenase [Pseudomonadaceae]|nr:MULTISPECIES: dioxygenase [Pseudomonadaceae]MDB1107855.1 dioxygenase [Pseudomonas extremaustralis]
MNSEVIASKDMPLQETLTNSLESEQHKSAMPQFNDVDLNGLFEESRSVEVVNARMTDLGDPRTREVMGVIVKHLHAAIKEIEPTHEEWHAAIEFLTDVGHMCNDWRQEFILLSDVLGASMLTEVINDRHQTGSQPPTSNTVLGPFYLPGAPRYSTGSNICLDEKGEPLLVIGYVKDTEGRPIAGATLDIWQTNEDGFYDVQQRGIQPDFNLRGVFVSEADGHYAFRTSKPRHYPIPSDGPVGKLLSRIGRHPHRAAHIHFIVTAPGYDPVTTHIFAPDCPYLREDTVFGVRPDLIATIDTLSDADMAKRFGMKAPFLHINWDFVLQPITPAGE